jgi:hypothetical protein
MFSSIRIILMFIADTSACDSSAKQRLSTLIFLSPVRGRDCSELGWRIVSRSVSAGMEKNLAAAAGSNKLEIQG